MTTKTHDNTAPAPTFTVEPFVNVKTAAKFLEVPENTIYKLALSRRIPSYKAGKLRRFKLSELAAAMDKTRVCAED